MDTTDQLAEVPINIRRSTEGDKGFRYQLFLETAGAELMAAVGDERLLQMQYRARETSYATNFPEAEEELICLPDGRPVGRVLIDQRADAMHLVDIGLLPSCRGQGIGTVVLKQLQQRCEGNAVRLELQVAQGNPAIDLYRKLGFSVESQDAMYVQMAWQPTRQFS